MPFRVFALYVGAAALCCLTLSLRLGLEKLVEIPRPLTIIFLLPVLISSYFGGLRIGAFATLLSSALLSVFVIKDAPLATELSYIGLFVLVGLMISVVCERLRKSREDLLASLQQLELATSAAKLGILDYNLVTKRLHLSPTLREIAGIAPDVEVSLDQWLSNIHPTQTQLVADKIDQAQDPEHPEQREFRRKLVRPNGDTIWVDVRGTTVFDRVLGTLQPVRSVVVYKDVTPEIERAKSVAEAQRFESLGRLTSGVVHNFNNVLQMISGNLELAKVKVQPPSKFIEDANAAAAMGARLVDRLSRIVRRQELSITSFSINDLVSSLPKLAAPLLGPDVEIDVVAKAVPDRILGDFSEVESALVNLLKNSREAMPSGGRVRILTANRHYDAPVSWLGGTLSAGDYVEISVSDTGQGMDEQTVSRCAEPFFTTKSELGTGLGLSTVLGYVVQTGGMLSIESSVGKGTTVTLTLPMTAQR